jgi:hypothetical protein
MVRASIALHLLRWAANLLADQGFDVAQTTQTL